MSQSMHELDGRKLRALRERATLTLAELANDVGVHFSTIGRIERGQRQPSVKLRARILVRLGASLDDVVKNDQVLAA